MKTKLVLLAIGLSFKLIGLQAQDVSNKAKWAKIDSLEDNGLPKSALAIVDEIFKQAQTEKDYPQFIKSLILKMKYKTIVDYEFFDQHLKDAERVADSATFPAKPILHSMLSEMYWWYIQNNRYKLYGRTQTIQFTSNDIATWDLKRLIGKVVEHYKLSLIDGDRLKMIDLKNYQDIINYHRESDIKDHPTLYDFLVIRAFNFFRNEESGLTRPEEEFSMNNEDFFLLADSFSKITIQTPDTNAFKYYAISLLQDLIKFHLNDSLPAVLVETDLSRLAFVNQYSTSSDKDSLYLKSLYYLEKKSIGDPTEAKVGIAIAEKIYSLGELYNPRVSEAHKWDKKKALERSRVIGKKYPYAGSQSSNFNAKVESQSVELTLEKENLPEEPFRALIAYKNVSRVFIKVVRTTYREMDDLQERYQKQRETQYAPWESYLLDHLKSKKAATRFSIVLPDDHDYQKHYTEIKVPALKTGLYYILASSSDSMDYKNSKVNYGYTSVTNVSYIQRRNGDGSNDFYVLHRKTGLPLEGVIAKCITGRYDYNKQKYESLFKKEYTSNEEGLIHSTFKDLKNDNFWLEFNYNGDVFCTRNLDNQYEGSFYNYSGDDDDDIDTKTFFFTDRAIYRPGQTIYFKGIMVETDHQKKNKLLVNKSTTVTLYNVNSQEVDRVNLTTNEFGSFSGSFTAPTSGLNGQMFIEGDKGRIYFSVEDYKRPKFEVKYDTLKTSYKVGQMVKVKGIAKAYSGANIDNATVKYRVVRKVRYFWWWNEWWNPRPSSTDKEIVHGTTTTDKNGEFDVSFKAIPDESIAPSTNPTFTYEIKADVTDINGETHSGEKKVNVGYKALLINATVPAMIEKGNISDYKINTTNQNGDFVASTGIIKVYKLKGPEKVYRNRMWGKPDKHTLSKEVYSQTFPLDQYDDELTPTTWAIEKKVLQTSFNTENSKIIKFNDLKSWDDGMYKLIVESQDSYGESVQQTTFFTLFDKKSTSMPYAMASWHVPIKNSGEPGEKAEIVYSSGYEGETKALIEVEAANKIVAREWATLRDSWQSFEHLIKEEYRGNIGIHYTFVKNNRLYTYSTDIYVPYTNKKLDINFETFRNKLQPGENDEWRLRIKGKTGEKAAAEMVATLYDASLDAFRPQSFNFDIWPYYRSRLFWGSLNSFKSNNFVTHTLKQEYFNTAFPTNQYLLEWFGFGYTVYYRPTHYKEEWVAEPTKSSFKIISSSKQKGSEVSGIVYDVNTNDPLIGVSIQIEGAAIGVITDVNGQFKISSDKNDITLIFSYVGYMSETVKLKNKGKTKLQVNLAPDIKRLEEVVVVGYGVQKKADLTGSVVTVTSAALAPIVGKVIEPKEEKTPDLSTVQARTNLNETAFFFPHLQTDENGDVLIKFTIPEALTRWKMLGFAHTKDLAYGFTNNELVTQKDLMVTPNAPRFFRENDTMIFTAKVTSLSDKDLTGSAQLMLFDALTMKPLDTQMQNKNAQQSFEVKKGESANLNWQIVVPTGLQAVTYRVVAKAGKFSDGEESTLPVLTNNMLVTETLPLPVKGKRTKTYTLDKLMHNTSTTLRNHKLTLEFTSNPAWYAIQALPYLMEYPYECAEQTFSRFYANSIATSIANSAPRIKQVFDSWKNITPDALLSNLEKNQELKGLILEETPWVWEAKDESQRKRNLALLFDLNRMSNELGRALDKLQKIQAPNGGFPWFEGLPDDRYITQHIICGMGKLDHLGVKNIRTDNKTWNMVSRAISYTDDRIYEDYRELVKLEKTGKLKLSDNHLGYTQIHYLYTRSFFTDVSMNSNTKEALNYYLGQARKYWLSNGTYMQGMISLALSRYKDEKIPLHIIKSFKERAITSEEMGMYWKYDNGWYWYQAPIETQALMIEAFDEVAHDTTSVNEMKVWLLKQKQTQDWRTTKATAEACYALLLRGSNWLENDEMADITVGNQKVDPKKMPEVKVEAGTGYFKTSWNGSDIKPEMGKVTITKKDNGISWGALYWQYFEQLDKITSSETPLKLKKQLFVERNTSAGPVIQLISDTTHLKPGDLLKVRIELRVDRTMEYVHMKDMRASGLEPTNVLSRYKYQDGLWYYESTRDAATNFFVGWLPKGTYVFEYPLRVTHYGNFSNGITTIQSMYAPEFTSHSEGVRVKVK